MNKARRTSPKPLLVTGAPRSGTTWVGEMFAASGSYHYLYEPFNPNAGIGRDVCDVEFTRYFTYISADDEAAYLAPIKDMIEGRYRSWKAVAAARSRADLVRVWRRYREFAALRRRGIQPLLKDPIALMSAEWLASRFDIDVVVMIRHPAAFVSSMRRMGWGYFPRNWALSQPALLRDFLEPLREELESLAEGGYSIDHTALGWKVMHHVIARYQERHPHWLFVRHEDLSLDPIGGFTALYDRLGLEFTAPVRATIEKYSSASNPEQAEGQAKTLQLNSKKNVKSWLKRLTPDEIARIRDRVEPLASRFYGDADWREQA